MIDDRPAVLEIQDLRKDYRGLRPLRLDQLVVGAGESVALLGLDAAAAEILVNLITGATLPDDGDVRVLGASTRNIADETKWLAWLDHFGIVTERAVLLNELTVQQNLAIPFSLLVDALPPDVLASVTALASDVGLSGEDLASRVHEVSPLVRARVRLGRALAIAPVLVLLEHPTVSLSESERRAFGDDLKRVVAAKRLALLALTSDADFARAVARRVLTVDQSSGRVKRRG